MFKDNNKPGMIQQNITKTFHSPDASTTSWSFSRKLFCKADRFFGPFSIRTVQNSLDNSDSCLPLLQGCSPLLINSTAGHYTSIGTTILTSGQPFLWPYNKALEHTFIELDSTSMHCHFYWNTESLRNTDTSILWICSGDRMVSTLEGFVNWRTKMRRPGNEAS